MNVRLTMAAETLSVGDVPELTSANAGTFREQVAQAVSEEAKIIEIDLSRTAFVDSSGLGALVSLNRLARSRSGFVRLLNPAVHIRQVLEMTRMHRIFEIVGETAAAGGVTRGPE